LRGIQGEIGFDGPGVAVLGGESGGFVVGVETRLGVPEEGISGCV
jgi:hypothetical protein